MNPVVYDGIISIAGAAVLTLCGFLIKPLRNYRVITKQGTCPRVVGGRFYCDWNSHPFFPDNKNRKGTEQAFYGVKETRNDFTMVRCDIGGD